MSVSLGFNEANFMRHNILKAADETMKHAMTIELAYTHS